LQKSREGRPGVEKLTLSVCHSESMMSPEKNISGEANPSVRQWRSRETRETERPEV